MIALIRYRVMIPLMYLVLLLEHATRRVLIFLNPIERSETLPIGFYINLGLLAVLAIGFVLSLQAKRGPRLVREGAN